MKSQIDGHHIWLRNVHHTMNGNNSNELKNAHATYTKFHKTFLSAFLYTKHKTQPRVFAAVYVEDSKQTLYGE